jgi:release factor glutamine methyltransferase
MRKVFKYIVGKTYRPLLIKYLAKTRVYRYRNILLEIPPEVFHPRFFFSTKLLLDFVSRMDLEEKTFLELGAGSGLISIYAHKKRASVTASDINPIAVKALVKNRLLNQSNFEVIQSDLFDALQGKRFDIIAINPPYYRRKPVSPADYAWYCGEEGEYFERLFGSLKDHVHKDSMVLMILCDGCDLGMIGSLAAGKQVIMKPVYSKKNLIEQNMIYQLQLSNES